MIIIRLLLFYFTLSCFVSGSDLLSIGFWNIENLFDLENDPTKRDDEFAIGGKKNVTSDIYDLKIKRSVEVLTDLNVDIIGLCEVENISVLSVPITPEKKRGISDVSVSNPSTPTKKHVLADSDKKDKPASITQALEEPDGTGFTTKVVSEAPSDLDPQTRLQAVLHACHPRMQNVTCLGQYAGLWSVMNRAKKCPRH